MKMKKIMIYAYTSFNLGDDLFIKELCHRYPHVQFYLYCNPKYKINFEQFKNINVIPNTKIIYRGTNFLLRKFNVNLTVEDIIAKKKDAIIYIGGSIFMQSKGWENKLSRLEGIVTSNTPLFITGANFGPYDKEIFYKKYKELFRRTYGVSFRDEYSYNLFKDLPDVILADDVIFQMDTKKYQSDIKRNYIVISVIKPSIRKHLEGYDELYYQKIKDISVEFAKEGHKVILMSFCEREGDVEAINSIKSLIPEKYKDYIEYYNYKHDIDGALNVIAQSKYVVGTRFHAMILGWVFNKPVFPIAYSEKMTNVIKDIDFKGSYVDFNSLESLNPKLVYDAMTANTVDISEQREGAEKHFAKLDEYLK